MADTLYHSEIRIFPSSNRDVTTDRYGDNFVTEYNLSSLINKLIDTSAQGFVISTSTKKLATDEPYTAPAEFNIAGYFIHVDKWKTIIDAANEGDKGNNLNTSQTFVNFLKVTEGNNTYIAARIIIDKPEGASEAYWKLRGQDSTDNSTSTFSEDPTNMLTLMLTLKLLLNVGNEENPNWIINPDAKLKFSNINIDDGRVS